jgi:hypothetical protein
MGHAAGFCVIHEGRMKRVDEAEVKAVAEQLLANDVELRTKDDVNRLTSQLYTMVAEKRISRQDGSLLAYIASVLLQTITPVTPERVVEEMPEILKSAEVPIPREQIYRDAIYRERPMPGRTYDPYMHPTKLR